ncbi:pectate lyase family protein [Flavobacterium hibisci]|uniref:pectate lyase family protein n=1 Tax=Flavobacterium hibisci TaxID=1914462 RepID=UPI001CBEF0E5|nr:T9SS type A sorting domain-containing protein [Flavobacterium hibisci]MBZ4042724.1 T9SS type A sorting domain-containing protein [Flavobacterium hibisci]
MKKFLLYVALIFISSNIKAQTITKSSGWLESAFVEWSPVAGADSYNVYYTGGGETNKKIDEQLIRSYGTYFRADVPGIIAGSYTLTVKPVTANVEGSGTTTQMLTVIAHDRNGFAFEGGRVPGGYKADGAPKTGAVILYVTQHTKNTITYNIVTSSKGAVTSYTGLQNILYGIKKGYDTRPFIIRLIGNITDMTVMEGGDITIENANNANSYLTLEGVGNDAVVNGMGVRLKSASNIEVSNLGFMNCNSTAGDNIGMQQDNDHIWVHNNDLFYGNAGSDADQIKGDGALDNKNSTYITLSYNHFWDSGKASLLGLSENKTTDLYITYHHNWFDHSDSRHPRVRFYSAHIYNNYYDGNSKYGAGATSGSSLFVEGNYFRNCKNPMMTSLQGTDIWSSSKQINDAGNEGTFSEEAGGTIKAFNNTFDADIATNSMRFVAYGDTNPLYNIAGKISSTSDFDAYLATTRDEIVPATVTSKSGANTYNNFDTNVALYVKNLTIDSPADAKAKVMQYAGRVSGGDLKWVFDNAVDDKSYLVITALKQALTDYVSKMVAVQGETVAPGNQTLTATTNNNNQTVTSGAAISNIVFSWGGDATDASVTGLPNGITATKNATAKTLTLSGIPTETMEYTVTTTGSVGTSASDSGTITMLPPSSQVLTSSSNKNQTIALGAAIAPIVLTWSGDAEDAEVGTLPAGLGSVKDISAKTITISGTPTATGSVTFTVTTSGSAGTPVAVSGTIVVNTVSVGDQIHNFTTATPTPVTSSFYTISGSMNSSPVTINYSGQTLTKSLKIETSTSITFTVASAATLVLVMDPSLDATKRTYVVPTGTAVGNTYSYTAVNGVTTISLPAAGSYTILKRDSGNLYYIKVSYPTLGLEDNIKTSKLILYPNPVSQQLFISSQDQKVKDVMIYNLSGTVVKNISNLAEETVDVSDLATGNYFIRITTDQNSVTKKIIKK